MSEKENTSKHRTLFKSKESQKHPLAGDTASLPTTCINPPSLCSGIRKDPDGTRTGISFEKMVSRESSQKN